MGRLHHLIGSIKKVKKIPLEFLIQVIEIIKYTKRNGFTVRAFVKYLGLSRKTIDTHLKALVVSNAMYIETRFNNKKKSTKKINFYIVEKELLEPLVLLSDKLQSL